MVKSNNFSLSKIPDMFTILTGREVSYYVNGNVLNINKSSKKHNENQPVTNLTTKKIC